MFPISDKAKTTIAAISQFMEEKIFPLEKSMQTASHHGNPNWQQWQINPAIESLKKEAKAIGLWNLFLPEISGFTNLEYAMMAEVMGQSLLASEIFNCNAPDTGNMEVLWKYGNEEQKKTWLTPLLDGEIRSAFCMTEPEVASSDATNMEATIEEDGDNIILNGKKWWSTGIGHPNCKMLIFMGLSSQSAEKHLRHSMVIVPIDSKGVTIKRMLSVFGGYDPPFGHGEVHFDNVQLPKTAIIKGVGKGFEIAQGRLGPGRVHHCMRLIGTAERALRLMIERGKSRVAFGRPIIELNGNKDMVAEARMSIDMARLLVLKTAFLLDTKGVKAAMSEVSQIKVIAPRVACAVIDQAMQMFGGEGLSDDTPLAAMYAYSRILRLADGPDEVHRSVVANMELKKYLH
jgi:acyl-CoA dehydrogenase